MEVGILISSAIALLRPLFKKTSETVAEEAGVTLWSWIKSKFKTTLPDVPGAEDEETISALLKKAIATNASFAKELEQKIADLHQTVSSQGQIVVQNSGSIEKMVNVTNNSGTINL